MGKKTSARTLLVLILISGLFYQPVPAEHRSIEEFSQQVNDLLHRPKFRSTSWGIQILDPDNDEILYAKNADKLFVPASNTKLFTTVTAFEKLGPDFRFKTNAFITGSPSASGVVDGDLILEGRGAFNFSNLIHTAYSPTAILTDLSIQIAAKGIRQIEGDLIANDAYFPHTHQPVVVRKYARRGRRKGKVVNKTVTSVVCPLAPQDGVIRIAVSPGGAPGQKVTVFTAPEARYLQVENRGITGPRRAKRTLTVTKKGSNGIVISGKLPVSSSGYHCTLPIEDPPKFMAALFKDILAQHGVKVVGSVRSCYGRAQCGLAREYWQSVAVHESLPLVDIIQVINKESHNSMAELLLRSLGSEVRGEGTLEAGLAVEADFLQEIGVNPSQANLVDGSGLSKENLVTPQAVTRLLKHVYQREYFPSFFGTLAINGVDGTLRRRMDQPELRERIHAKTGTLSNSITLSGYVALERNRRILFSIMANRLTISAHSARRMIDQICDLIVGHFGSDDGTSPLQDAIIRTAKNEAAGHLHMSGPASYAHRN
ncbi:MAG: D-alanyl-D-alanine carboxypeptidase/D-alanyl-D-alanine-endopeptidase [Acidobacteria bacterium]|nr:D-alanyl-D-alanine carboxypeptidase/D-alanyl-D-alanine-endopeptidase [Acidobacteriota bacterium]MBI3656208.1 D-alanyl-D-alanine carboxypeptidase/D-alanyl-D-alanine-endopeptidase [Acidobacteriota bacterium]